MSYTKVDCSHLTADAKGFMESLKYLFLQNLLQITQMKHISPYSVNKKVRGLQQIFGLLFSINITLNQLQNEIQIFKVKMKL